LNLAGVILPGPRVPAVPSNFVVFRDGVVVRSMIGRDSRSGEGDLRANLPTVARSK
jgi:ATP-dependent helicase Lhr and Lhr-like helicase